MVWGQIFGTICGIDVGIGIPIFAALRAAVFELSAKNLRGGRIPAPPPIGARVKRLEEKEMVACVLSRECYYYFQYFALTFAKTNKNPAAIIENGM